MGVLLWRGFGLDNVMAQCFGHEGDTSGKGRQMPVVSVIRLTNPAPLTLFRSILVLPNIISTPYHHPSRLRYPRLPVWATRFADRPADVRVQSRRVSLGRARLPKEVGPLHGIYPVPVY